MTTTSGIALGFPFLGAHETKESIDAWYVQAKSIIRAMPAYMPYVDMVWIAKKTDSTRGFKNTVGADGTVLETKELKNSQVESIIELIMSHCTELNASNMKARSCFL